MPAVITRKSLIGVCIVGALVLTTSSTPRVRAAAEVAAVPLSPTVHRPVAREAAHLWMAPSMADRAAATAHPALVQLQAAVRLFADGRYEESLGRFSAAATPKSPLAAYASYYAGLAELRLSRFADARRRLGLLKGTSGFVGEAAALGEAEAAEGMGDHADAVACYEALLTNGPTDPPAVWLGLARAATAAGNEARAAEAHLRLYYGFPLSEQALQAKGPLQTVSEVPPALGQDSVRYKLEMGRGEQLFDGRRYPEARASFERLQPHASGADAELVALRLAEIDYFQKRYRDARLALGPYLQSGTRQAEARYFDLMSQRGLRNYAVFEQLVHVLANDFPDSPWVEEALNNLATYYIQQDRDDEADAVLRDMYTRFPRGRHAERAAWKAGWTAYRKGNLEETVRYFESAAANFQRSDYRPAWLYWSGRARDAMGDRAGAVTRLRLVRADYQNTYYGRLAEAILAKQGAGSGPSHLIFAKTSAQLGKDLDYFPPTGDVVRTLLALGLYDPAVRELEFARAKWGDSPAVTATIAWANKQMAESETGSRQFALARGSITMIKRAYPQFMADGGEQLPREILTTIFPLSYWDLIRKYSAQHDLDPFLVAALMAQESTFVRDVKSHAGAYGLMQMMPATGRLYARKMKLRYSTRLLTTPETNVRLGTALLAELMRQFGSVHLALASYNAGETAVRRWLRERPSMMQDEFIDDIPYRETQQYVKRILGTAVDYRRLYQ